MVDYDSFLKLRTQDGMLSILVAILWRPVYLSIYLLVVHFGIRKGNDLGLGT